MHVRAAAPPIMGTDMGTDKSLAGHGTDHGTDLEPIPARRRFRTRGAIPSRPVSLSTRRFRYLTETRICRKPSGESPRGIGGFYRRGRRSTHANLYLSAWMHAADVYGGPAR